MIASQTPVDSRRLLALAAAGYSQRWIARRLGLKPTYVRQRLNELLGRAIDESCEKQEENAFSESESPPHLLPDDDRPPGFNTANIRRCQGCGALVYLWPCLACHMAGNVPSPSAQE